MTTTIMEWCKSILVTTPQRWRNLVESVPLELLTMPPAPGEWSALECLQHLVDVEKNSFPVRLDALLTGKPMVSFNPDAADRPPKAPPTIALLDEFEKLRKENMAQLDQITEADLDRETLHPEYGMVSMRQFLHHRAAHDLMHTVQAERALMQPFINGAGPWEVNYTDHIARVKG